MIEFSLTDASLRASRAFNARTSINKSGGRHSHTYAIFNFSKKFDTLSQFLHFSVSIYTLVRVLIFFLSNLSLLFKNEWYRRSESCEPLFHEPIIDIILISSQPAELKQAQASTMRKENLLVDELPSVIEEAELQSISQQYNLRIDSFELIKCHGRLRANLFFNEID